MNKGTPHGHFLPAAAQSRVDYGPFGLVLYFFASHARAGVRNGASLSAQAGTSGREEGTERRIDRPNVAFAVRRRLPAGDSN